MAMVKLLGRRPVSRGSACVAESHQLQLALGEIGSSRDSGVKGRGLRRNVVRQLC